MVTVKRANVILTVLDEEIPKYLEKGFSVIDGNGNVVKAGAPKDIGALQTLLQEKDSEIANLKKEIEKLKAEIHSAKAKAAEEEIAVPENADVIVEEPKKKSSYKRKTQQ